METVSSIINVDWGETVSGIAIKERNRATVYEFDDDKEAITILIDMWAAYLSKGVNAVLASVVNFPGLPIAVFVQENFLTEVD